jgi:hypothetical protein
VATKKGTTAKRLFDLPAVLGGRHLVNLTVGPYLGPVLLSVGRKGAARRAFRVHYLVDRTWQALDLAATAEDYQFVQPLPGGRWLLIRSRACDEQDNNARVFGPDGSVVASFHAGDGIEHVQATEQGHIWIGYFDEGVFGDSTLGRNGLVCLDQDGRPVFRFGDLDDPVVGGMADCYALNVCSGKEVWTCYYTDFPLVQLLEGTLGGWWSIPVDGARGFAVVDGRVLLGGGYDSKDSLFLGDLGSSRFQEITPTDEAGKPLKRFWVFGRRHLLYLASETALHVLDLRSL